MNIEIQSSICTEAIYFSSFHIIMHHMVILWTKLETIVKVLAYTEPAHAQFPPPNSKVGSLRTQTWGSLMCAITFRMRHLLHAQILINLQNFVWKNYLNCSTKLVTKTLTALLSGMCFENFKINSYMFVIDYHGKLLIYKIKYLYLTITSQLMTEPVDHNTFNSIVNFPV